MGCLFVSIIYNVAPKEKGLSFTVWLQSCPFHKKPASEPSGSRFPSSYLLDPALGCPFLDLLEVVTEEKLGIQLLLHLLHTLQVVKEFIGGLVDGAPRRNSLVIAVPGVDGITGGEDGTALLGLQDQADHARGVGLLHKEPKVLRQPGILVDGLELDALHVKQGADVSPAVAGGDTEPSLLQVGLRDQDIFYGLGAHKVLQTGSVVKVQMGDDDLVDIVRGQTLGGQGLLHRDALHHRIIVQHIRSIEGLMLVAVAGII